jgi:hypothetical protein
MQSADPQEVSDCLRQASRRLSKRHLARLAEQSAQAAPLAEVEAPAPLAVKAIAQEPEAIHPATGDSFKRVGYKAVITITADPDGTIRPDRQVKIANKTYDFFAPSQRDLFLDNYELIESQAKAVTSKPLPASQGAFNVLGVLRGRKEESR